MEIELGQLIPAVLAGIVAGAGTWFTLARSLVTRTEVERMIQDRMEALGAGQAEQKRLIEGMRTELVALRGEVIRLGVLLGVERSRERGLPVGTIETKGN